MAPLFRRTRTTTTRVGVSGSGPVPWSAARLRLLLAAGSVLVAALLTGLGYAVYVLVAGVPTEASAAGPGPAGYATGTGIPTAAAGAASGPARRDEIAAAPMMAVRPGDARGGRPAVPPAPGFVVPPATRADGLDVPTGFAHTPAGAVAQLAAIQVAVYARMDIAYTGAVHAAWTAPGAPGLVQWPTTGNVQSFLQAADIPGGRIDATVRVRVVPAAAILKGVDGPDWVLACVLLDISATIQDRARMGYGSCERMQWQPGPGIPGGRWVIAAGASPAPAPSTWPGSQTAAAAGWLTWIEEGDR